VQKAQVVEGLVANGGAAIRLGRAGGPLIAGRRVASYPVASAQRAGRRLGRLRCEWPLRRGFGMIFVCLPDGGRGRITRPYPRCMQRAGGRRAAVPHRAHSRPAALPKAFWRHAADHLLRLHAANIRAYRWRASGNHVGALRGAIRRSPMVGKIMLRPIGTSPRNYLHNSAVSAADNAAPSGG
jgi:hypothetical protein